MDDPSLTKGVKGSSRTVRRLLAMALGLLAGSAPVGLHADDSVVTAPRPSIANRQNHSDPHALSALAEGSAGPALAPAAEAFAGFERLPPISSVYLPAAGRAGEGIVESPGSLFQLTSLQEPAAETGETPSGDVQGDKKEGEKKPGEEPPKFGREPVSNAVQFLRAQDVLLAPGAWQADTGLVYAHFDNDFPVPIRDPITNEINDVVEGLVRRRLLYSPLAARYGLSRNVQLFGVLPVGYSNTQISTFGVSDSTNTFGIGDLTAGVNVHLLKAEEELPDVITTMDFTAPTGNFAAPVFGLVPGSNLGQGFWAMSASVLFIHRYDPVIVFYGGGYRHLFEREFAGLLFSPGEQISYQFGVGFSVNDRVTLSTAFQGFYITQVQIDNATVPGTNLEPLGLRFAATIARNCRIIEPFVSIGLTESAPAANLGMVVTFY